MQYENRTKQGQIVHSHEHYRKACIEGGKNLKKMQLFQKIKITEMHENI